MCYPWHRLKPPVRAVKIAIFLCICDLTVETGPGTHPAYYRISHADGDVGGSSMFPHTVLPP